MKINVRVTASIALVMMMFCLSAVHFKAQTNRQSPNTQAASLEPSRTGKRFSQVVLKVDYVLPTVHISEYSTRPPTAPPGSSGVSATGE